MLNLRLTPYSENSTWTWSGERYSTLDGRSDITPYDHPMVEHLAATDGRRAMIMVRERVADRPTCDPQVRELTSDEYDQARDLLARWPTDYVLAETESAHPVRVSAGAARITPCTWPPTTRPWSVPGTWPICGSTPTASTPRRPPGC